MTAKQVKIMYIDMFQQKNRKRKEEKEHVLNAILLQTTWDNRVALWFSITRIDAGGIVLTDI